MHFTLPMAATKCSALQQQQQQQQQQEQTG
jgi:hypothetical protein